MRLFQDGIKNKTKRIALISEEFVCLCQKLNFPTISKQQVSSKIFRLANDYISYRKKKTKKFEKQLENVFDTTKIDGFWLCKEDKGFYKKQMESQGCIGYTTSKFATKCTIHPSKRSRMNTEVTYGSCSTPDNPETSSNESTAENNDSSSSEYTTEDQTSKRKYHSAKSASGLVLKFTLSTRQASRVCQSLADGGVDLPTPSQTATWRRVIENGKIKAEKIKHLLRNEKNFCLHFDGKRIGKKEASPTRSLNLSAVCCDGGSSECIFPEIKKIMHFHRCLVQHPNDNL